MKKVHMQSCVWLLVLSLIAPVAGIAQDTGSAPPLFRQEELDQMLAPIALYPDSLLIQVLMASTYPLEVVQAARWVNSNSNLKGEKLAIALDQKYWDPSVKSLVNFPSVLAMMNDKLEWTQDIGDAFLGQKDQVMATVQNLRAKAQAQGSLKTTSEQVVVVQEKTIVIESANPQVVYVPAYNPTIVYGTWWYPAYPPYYYYPPGYAVAGASIVSFGVGVTVGAAWGYAWGSVNWASNQVYVNPAQNVTINNTFNTNVVQNNANINVNKNVSNRFNQANINAQNTVNSGQGASEWRHDPTHRKGVAYKDPSVRQQFGQTGTPGAEARKNFRGFDQGSIDRTAKQGGQPEQFRNPSSQKDRSTSPQRNEAAGMGAMGQDRQTSGSRKSTSGMDGVQRERTTTPQNRSSSAIESLNRSGGEVRQQSDRGRSSRESLPTQKPSQLFQGGRVNPGEGAPNPGGGGGGSHPNIGGGGGRPMIGGGRHQ